MQYTNLPLFFKVLLFPARMYLALLVIMLTFGYESRKEKQRRRVKAYVVSYQIREILEEIYADSTQ